LLLAFEINISDVYFEKISMYFGGDFLKVHLSKQNEKKQDQDWWK
jgi:hypothetical protein